MSAIKDEDEGRSLVLPFVLVERTFQGGAFSMVKHTGRARS